MNRKYNKHELFANFRGQLFFYTILSEVSSVRNWTERLIKCGIPEKTAVRIVDFFFKNRRTIELIAYVRMTEEALKR